VQRYHVKQLRYFKGLCQFGNFPAEPDLRCIFIPFTGETVVLVNRCGDGRRFTKACSLVTILSNNRSNIVCDDFAAHISTVTEHFIGAGNRFTGEEQPFGKRFCQFSTRAIMAGSGGSIGTERPRVIGPARQD
jgi:hypothetical protein